MNDIQSDRPHVKITKMNGRNVVSVHIRGLAFRCGSGSRREQVLTSLKQLDETPGWIIPLCAMLAGFIAGFGAGWLV